MEKPMQILEQICDFTLDNDCNGLDGICKKEYSFMKRTYTIPPSHSLAIPKDTDVIIGIIGKNIDITYFISSYYLGTQKITSANDVYEPCSIGMIPIIKLHYHSLLIKNNSTEECSFQLVHCFLRTNVRLFLDRYNFHFEKDDSIILYCYGMVRIAEKNYSEIQKSLQIPHYKTDQQYKIDLLHLHQLSNFHLKRIKQKPNLLMCMALNRNHELQEAIEYKQIFDIINIYDSVVDTYLC